MSNKKMSRRQFLRTSAVTAVGVATAGSAASAFAAPPTQDMIVLEVMSLAEYEGPYREICSQYPKDTGVTIEVFSINEDTAAAHGDGDAIPLLGLGTQIEFSDFGADCSGDIFEGGRFEFLADAHHAGVGHGELLHVVEFASVSAGLNIGKISLCLNRS